ncbi:aKG-HExxH-type peptide beta-hydroxylase [Streptomyces sp. NPDC001658]
MISAVLPEASLRELGRTAGSPDTLALLVRDQHTRRLLLLRAVLDAVEAADARVCPRPVRARLREDWALLEAADRSGGSAGAGAWPGAGLRASAALDRLLYPLVGPWARNCLRLLGGGAEEGDGGDDASGEGEGRVRLLERDLAHFSALAVAAAVRARVPFAVRLVARDGVLVIPSLGVLRTADTGKVPVDVALRGERVTFRQPGAAAADTSVRLNADGTTVRSDTAAWTPAYALPGLVPGAEAVPLDDADPYRVAGPQARQQDPSGPAHVDAVGWAGWLRSWAGTAALLRLGGGHRVAEAVAVLRCVVPLATPDVLTAQTRSTGSCSGTRREAFGAVLSSFPPNPVAFAATLVHEIQHAKLAALSEMVVLHHAGPEERFFAPWRPGPRRPYEALLHGVYSHLALSDFFQRCALARAMPPLQREFAWDRHARHREQVRAALPAITEADHLTPAGRLLVDMLTEEGARMDADPPPAKVRENARTYVDRLHRQWRLKNAAPSG